MLPNCTSGTIDTFTHHDALALSVLAYHAGCSYLLTPGAKLAFGKLCVHMAWATLCKVVAADRLHACASM